MRRRPVLTTLLALAVSAGVLWWLLADTGVAEIAAAVGRAQAWQLALGLALVPAIQWLRAWRFELMLTGRLGPPGWPMFCVAARLLLFNFLLPFKLGELSFPLLMKSAFGTEIGRSAGILILARLMDFAVLAGGILLSAAAALDASRLHGWSRPALAAAGALALVAPLAVGLLAPLRALAPARAAPLADRLLWGVAMLRGAPRRLLALALTYGTWAGHAAVAYLAATAVAAGDVAFAAAALAAFAANVAFAAPVPVIAGLGPPQAAWAAALDLAGAPWETAVAGALLTHAVLLTGVVLLGAATLAASPDRPPWSAPRWLRSPRGRRSLADGQPGGPAR